MKTTRTEPVVYAEEQGRMVARHPLMPSNPEVERVYRMIDLIHFDPTPPVLIDPGET